MFIMMPPRKLKEYKYHHITDINIRESENDYGYVYQVKVDVEYGGHNESIVISTVMKNAPEVIKRIKNEMVKKPFPIVYDILQGEQCLTRLRRYLCRMNPCEKKKYLKTIFEMILNDRECYTHGKIKPISPMED